PRRCWPGWSVEPRIASRGSPGARTNLRKLMTLLSLVALMLLPLSASAGTTLALEIDWNDLRSSDSPAAQAAPDASGTLSWNLDGKTVQLAGYVLPSDREGDLVYQF